MFPQIAGASIPSKRNFCKTSGFAGVPAVLLSWRIVMNLRMNAAAYARALAALLLLLCSAVVRAQSTSYTEDFTGTTTNNQWFFYNGACLTAGTNTSTTSPNYVPGCLSVMNTYYNVADSTTGKQADTYLAGGYYGYLGSSTAPSSASAQTADPIINLVGHGALRFTNGNSNGTNSSFGHHENGAIVSNFTFPTGQGLAITFKTVTYYGDSGGAASDGADGISFYLLDGCMPLAGGSVPQGCPANSIYGSTGATFPGIGAWGGSLAYSCSNSNPPYDGLVGAYLGLGIDEYGNFLNGWQNTLGETDSSTSSTYGDNTASGGLYKPGRIGLRGAGSVSWQALNTAYGTNLGSSSPYYPSTLATACAAGSTYVASTQNCASCSSGTYSASAGNCGTAYTCSSGTVVGTNCESCSTGGTLNTTTGQCNNICPANYVSVGSNCNTCLVGGTPTPGNLKSNNTACKNGGGTFTSVASTSAAATSTAATPQTVNASYSGTFDARTTVVQATCETGKLYTFPDHSVAGTSVGAASLSNTANTAGILDYPAIAGAWSVLSGVQIANESTRYREGNPQGCTGSACTSPPATPITYKLKITPNGLLSLQYSYNGGAYQPVLTSQSITSSNGPLPSSFRFGFAGSTGGASNIHEIVCFKATQAETSLSSGTVTVYENPELKLGTQVFTAFYNPGDWSGQLTAQTVGFNTTTNTLTISSRPNWDARCVLTGVDSTTGPCSTTATSMNAESYQASGGGRQILTWSGTGGIAFEWGSLTTTQQSALGSQSELNYLRGYRGDEITLTNPAPTGLYRYRSSVLSDIVDSSPTWIGPPQLPYTTVSTWVDSLYPTANMPENSGTTYSSFASTNSGRLNVVYVGSNDGFVHGFRAGSLDTSGNLVDNTSTPNDGYEVLAYMPGAVLQAIHNTTTPALDYSNTQYAHNWFVDATPATGDVFYGGTWHSWLVGGLGAGGAAFYALDVTDPSQFSEGNASALVKGEWTTSNLTCVNVITGGCANNLGNTFGTPLVRRFHNGQWGVIFGNGFGSANGTAGIFIMLIDSTSGATSFYYLGTNATTHNGIASAESLDLDLDHVVDYIYAGDLQGNVWRWDVTSANPATWASTTPFLLFTTPNGSSQPITTRPTAGALKTITTTVTLGGQTLSNGPEQVIVNFGTGQMTPQTLYSSTQYATGTQYVFGIWDWNMSGWNSISPGQQAMALAVSGGPGTINTLTNLVQQTVTTTAAATSTQVGTRTVSHNTICWQGSSTCSGGTKLGWYIALPGTQEQIVFDPVISPDGELVVNTLIPVTDSPLVCTTATSSGYSMGLQPDSGGGSPVPYFTVATNGNVQVDGVQLSGTGTPAFLSSGQQADSNSEYMITQTGTGVAPPTKINRHVIVSGQRLNWTQRR